MSDNKLDPDVYHVNPEKTNFPKYWKRMRHIPDFLSSFFSIMMNVYPMDMSQYRYLFQSARVPGHGCDTLVRDEAAKHVLFIRGGSKYEIEY